MSSKTKLYVIQAEIAPGQYSEGCPFEKLTEAVKHIRERAKCDVNYTAVHYYLLSGPFYFYNPSTRQEFRLSVQETKA